MGKSQRDKGARGEREVVEMLKEAGFFARRGQVFNGEPDIICPDIPFHLEVKRHETLEIPKWFKQSERDCGDLYPAVVYRQSRQPWLITMKVCDFLDFTAGEEVSQGARLTMVFEDFLELVKELIG